MKVTLLHTAVIRKGKFLHTILPIGIFNLATILANNNYEVEIIHLALEQLLNRDLDYTKFIPVDSDVYGVSINWYVHTYESINLIRKIKRIVPNSIVIVGGITSSFYAMEIMENVEEVDFLIKGDAEVPLLKLLNSLKQGKEDFENVPNLFWRKGDKVLNTGQTFIQTDLNSLPTPDITLLRNYKKYMKINTWGRIDVPLYASFDESMPSSFDLVLSRGCIFQCSYCSGGKYCHSLIFKRKNFIYRAPQLVFQDMVKFYEYGVRELRTRYIPFKGSNEYYNYIFDEMIKANITFGCRMSLWNLPQKELLKKMALGFQPLILEISPDSWDEGVRKYNKGPYYTNADLIELIEYSLKNNILVDLYFISGLPGETKQVHKQTCSKVKEILLNFPNVKATCFALSIEPASPLYLFPEKYNLRLFRRSFKDFYNWGEEVAKGLKLSHYLGLEFEDLSEQEILNRAKEFNAMALEYGARK